MISSPYALVANQHEPQKPMEPAGPTRELPIDRIVEGPFLPRPVPRVTQVVKLSENYELDLRFARWYEPGTKYYVREQDYVVAGSGYQAELFCYLIRDFRRTPWLFFSNIAIVYNSSQCKNIVDIFVDTLALFFQYCNRLQFITMQEYGGYFREHRKMEYILEWMGRKQRLDQWLSRIFVRTPKIVTPESESSSSRNHEVIHPPVPGPSLQTCTLWIAIPKLSTDLPLV